MTFRTLFFYIFCFVNVLSSLHIQAQNRVKFPAKPSAEHYYVDQANILTVEDARFIDTTSANLLKTDLVPIIVVTLPSLNAVYAGNYSIEDYAQQLFDHWKIGYSSRNYGVLLLLSMGDRSARIELGKAYENKFNDQTDYIMKKLMLPYFKQGHYSTGLRVGVDALNKMVRGLALPKPKIPWWLIPSILVGLILVIATTC